MLRNTFFAVLALVAYATSSQAAVMFEWTSEPTPNMATHTTWHGTATTTSGEIVGFDFAGGGGTFGFFGEMNQINPAGNATVFQDSNGFFGFVGADVKQDSQFKFMSSALVVPPGLAAEGPNQLKAAFAAAAPLGVSVPFVQLVLPTGGSVNFLGQVTVLDNGVFGDVDVQGVVPPDVTGDLEIVPGMVDVPLAFPRQLLTQTFQALLNDVPQDAQWSISSLKDGNPANPANLPSIAGGMFSWLPHLSDLNAGGADADWKFNITAAAGDLTADAMLTVRLVIPEPATLSLLGLAMVGCIGFIRRR